MDPRVNELLRKWNHGRKQEAIQAAKAGGSKLCAKFAAALAQHCGAIQADKFAESL